MSVNILLLIPGPSSLNPPDFYNELQLTSTGSSNRHSTIPQKTPPANRPSFTIQDEPERNHGELAKSLLVGQAWRHDPNHDRLRTPYR